jgi:hypothetical protein
MMTTMLGFLSCARAAPHIATLAITPITSETAKATLTLFNFLIAVAPSAVSGVLRLLERYLSGATGIAAVSSANQNNAGLGGG